MRVLNLTLLVLLCACSAPAHRADRVAARAGLTRALVRGDRFHHVTYARTEVGTPLIVYLDGDGLPWRAHGRKISADPTVRHPLALDLAARSGRHSVLYLGRPCYFGLAALQECHPTDWTSARYSAEIVHSLAACANRFIVEHGIQQVILIGHSGGGTLAVLMAPQVINLRAVITIAGNLDVKAWTDYHGYRPLTGSLDPAHTSPLQEAVTEIHLTGGRDTEIPPALLGRYLAAHPRAQHWRYPRFDHRCCWKDAWPELLPQLIQVTLPQDSSAPPARSGTGSSTEAALGPSGLPGPRNVIQRQLVQVTRNRGRVDGPPWLTRER